MSYRLRPSFAVSYAVPINSVQTEGFLQLLILVWPILRQVNLAHQHAVFAESASRESS